MALARRGRAVQETVVAPIGARSQEVSWRAAANIVPAEPGRPRPRNQAAAGTGLPRRNSVLDLVYYMLAQQEEIRINTVYFLV